ncbi:hypothetical protein H0H93_000967 [Arthromyces matolae]|nr:hypothetical protein H0H93_000967 [Arthromyces matolae]
MPLEAYDIELTELDSPRIEFDQFDDGDERSALFDGQPHNDDHNPFRVQEHQPSRRYVPYFAPSKRVRVFKNIEMVPDVTLTFVQEPQNHNLFHNEYNTPYGSDLSASPVFSDLSSPDATCYSPSPSIVPLSIVPDVQAITCLSPSELCLPILDALTISPLLSLNDLWDVAPESPPVSASPSIRSFPDTSSEVDSMEAIDKPGESYDALNLVKREMDEEFSSVKRQCLDLSHSPRNPSGSPSSRNNKKKGSSKKEKRKKRKANTHLLPANFKFELSEDACLKLSPPDWEPTLKSPSTESVLSKSLSPLLDSRPTSPKKEFQESPSDRSVQSVMSTEVAGMTKPRTRSTPSVVNKIEAIDDYISKDFVIAQGMIHRRSGRHKGPVHYTFCDDEPADDKDTESPAHCNKRKDLQDEYQPTSRKATSTKQVLTPEGRYACPFGLICQETMARRHDVARHLFSNVLHTNASKSVYACSNCGAELSRQDSLNRHLNSGACGKRKATSRVKTVYSADVEKELDRIRNGDNQAVIAAKSLLEAEGIQWE